MFEGVYYSPNEINFFNQLFDIHGKMQPGAIAGAEVVQLFMKANVEKDKLKVIWDNSSKRKAANLSKEEFYYACRNVALAQLGMELIDENVRKMNGSNYLPVFQGIPFNMTVEIPQMQIKPDQQSQSQPQIQQNSSQSTISINYNNFNMSSSTSSFPMNTNNDNNIMSMSMPNIVNRNNNNNNNITVDDDDDFVAIDEDADKEIKPNASIKQVELNIVNSLLKDFDLSKHQKKIEEQKVIPSQPKIVQPQPQPFQPKNNLNDLFSLLDTDTHKEEKTSVKVDDDDEFVAIEEETPSTINNQPQEINENAPNKPMDFRLEPPTIKDKTHQQSFTPQLTQHMEQVFSPNDTMMKNNEENTPEIAKSRTANLNDLMGGFEFEFNNDALKTTTTAEEISKENNHNDHKEPKYSIEKSKTVEQKSTNSIIDDDDFCEVVEDDFKESANDTNTIPNTIPTSNPIDMIITNNLKPNQYEAKIIDTIENKEEQKYPELEPDLIATAKEEDKKPTHSILNFTPMDFLQEFKKEINPNEQATEDDQFEFVEEEDQCNNTSKPIKSTNPIEAKFSQFNSEQQKKKFYSNLQLIFQTINKEMIKIIPLLKVFTSFYSIKVSENNIFNDKKLSNFINGTIELLHLYQQFKETKRFLNEQIDIKQKNYEEIITLIKSIIESKNFAGIVNKKKLSDLDLVKEITCENNNTDIKDCLLCLYSSQKDKITNVFGYDFHIKCINLWLNMIDHKSPFNLVN